MDNLSASFTVCRLLLLLFAFFGRAEDSAILAQKGFENPIVFGPEAGLRDMYINAVAKDYLGFMWIGTTAGLFRFDGSTAQVFRHDPNDSLSLSDDRITDLAFDSTGQNLWLTTQKGGFNVMDIRTGHCRRYTHIEDGSKRIELISLYWVLTDAQKRVWIGGKQGLVEHNLIDHTSKLHTYPIEAADNDASLLQRIHTMTSGVEDRYNDSLLWTGTGSGLLAYNKVSGNFRRYLYPGGAGDAIHSNSIKNLYQHNDGALYCGTFNFGLFRFDPASGAFRPFPITGVTKYLDNWRNVFHIAFKSPQELWVTTYGGLAVLNTETHTFSIVAENDPANDRYWGVKYADEAGRRWNWHRGKLILFNDLYQQFQNFRCPESVSERDFIVRKIAADTSSGLLYLAAQLGDGLYILDRNTGKWVVIPPELPSGQGSESFHGWDILRTRGGEWLVLAREALYKFSVDRRKLFRHPFQPPLQEAFYRSMAEDYKGNLWIGSHYKGLIRLNLTDGATRIFKNELEAPGFPGSSIGCWHVLEDRLHQIWVRHSKGYSVYRPTRDTFYHIFPFGTDAKAHIERFAEDRVGRVWIVAPENGLGIADPQYPELGLKQWVSQGNFLKSNNPSWVLADLSSRIWVGSTKGLECLNPELNTSTFYPLAYGIGGPVESMALLSSGEIVLGHRTSVSIFHPDRLINNQEKPRPYLTSFKVFEHEYEMDTLLPQLQTVRLKHDQNYFSIEFSAVGFNLPGQQTFEYKLQGVDPKWVNPEKRRYTSYTNLASGDYVFNLRVANNEGVWCDQALRLHIHIATPWWNTWWAWCGYVALIIGSLYSWYRFQLRRQLEQADNLRLRELDEVKTRLYTNITHEFRTPLMVISGMADQITENPERWLEEGPRTIKYHGRSLLNLVNQMLDLRKLESGNLPLRMMHGDVLPYLKQLLESFRPYAENKNIGLHFLSEVPELPMDYDQEKLLNIVSNLVSNALKFTPEGGAVYLSADQLPPESDGAESLLIRIRDTGIGIPAGQLERIFEQFYQVDSGATRRAGGTGIGLSLTRELVKLMGGKISVQSAEGAGTEFSVALPITHGADAAFVIDPQTLRQQAAAFVPGAVEEGSVLPETETNEELPLVLIIEDNRDLVRYLWANLTGAYRVESAYDGQAGIEKALELIPDIVVSDVMMPEKDGFEVTRTLKTHPNTSHIPIVLLTAKADIESRLEGLGRGADAYLAKPFEKGELLLYLRNLLDMRLKLRRYYLDLAGAAPQEEIPPEAAAEVQIEDVFVQGVRALVEEHLDDYKFDVDQICRKVAMSRSQLHRKLTALTGYPANQFIRFIRLSKARQLLADTDEPIANIAYDTGFNDPDYFSRAFRKEFGLTPTECREQAR